MYKLGLSLYSTKNTALQNLQKTLSSPILYRANPSRKAANAPPVKKCVIPSNYFIHEVFHYYEKRPAPAIRATQ